MITQTDVNNDIRMLAESIEDSKRPLISPLQALKLSMLLPLSCAAVYAIAVTWTIYSFVPHIDHFDNMTTLTGEYGGGSCSECFSTVLLVNDWNFIIWTSTSLFVS